MRVAVIESGVVVNVIIWPDGQALPPDHVASDSADIGDTYDGSVFTKPTIPLAIQKATSLQAVRANFDTAYKQLTTDYTLGQVLSFDRMSQEHDLYQADNAASTPFIDGVLAEYTLWTTGKAAFMTSVGNDEDTFTGAMASIYGKLLNKSKQINDATTVAELPTDLSISLPSIDPEEKI